MMDERNYELRMKEKPPERVNVLNFVRLAFAIFILAGTLNAAQGICNSTTSYVAINLTNWNCNSTWCQFPINVTLNTTNQNGTNISFWASNNVTALGFWRETGNFSNATCTGNDTDFLVPASKAVSATAATNYTFTSWSLSGDCSVLSSVLIQVNSGECNATANFAYSPPGYVNVHYVSYGNRSNITGFGKAFDYSASVMETATGNADAFGLMVLSTVFIGFYIIGSRYTQERALVYSSFFTVVVAFLLVSGNFLSPNWLILSIIALLAAIYFANRVG